MTSKQLYAKSNRCVERAAELSDEARRARLAGSFKKAADLEAKSLAKIRESNRLYLASKK